MKKKAETLRLESLLLNVILSSCTFAVGVISLYVRFIVNNLMLICTESSPGRCHQVHIDA